MSGPKASTTVGSLAGKPPPSLPRGELWYSAAVSHVYGNPDLGSEKGRGPSPEYWGRGQPTPSLCLKLMIDFDSLIMVKLYC